MNPHIRDGNLNALFGNLAEEYGPVFQIRPPFSSPMIFLAGLETNRWVHKRGRMYLRARDYFSDFEKVYGASGVLPALDGADHFRLRKSLSPAYSAREAGRAARPALQSGAQVHGELDGWGLLPRHVHVPGDGERPALATVHQRRYPGPHGRPDEVQGTGPQRAYRQAPAQIHAEHPGHETPGESPGYTDAAGPGHPYPAQRAGSPRDLVDDYLSLHASDPQFLPESNLLFAFSAALIASVYLGDTFSLVVYAMASQPDLYARKSRPKQMPCSPRATLKERTSPPPTST